MAGVKRLRKTVEKKVESDKTYRNGSASQGSQGVTLIATINDYYKQTFIPVDSCSKVSFPRLLSC